MWWQNGKSLGQILHELHNEGIEMFLKVERFTFRIYLFIVAISMGVKVYVMYLFIYEKDLSASKYNLANDLFFVALLSMSFVSLVFRLRKE